MSRQRPATGLSDGEQPIERARAAARTCSEQMQAKAAGSPPLPCLLSASATVPQLRQFRFCPASRSIMGILGPRPRRNAPGSGSFFVEKSFKQLVRDMLDWGAGLERVSLHPVMDSFLYAY